MNFGQFMELWSWTLLIPFAWFLSVAGLAECISYIFEQDEGKVNSFVKRFCFFHRVNEVNYYAREESWVGGVFIGSLVGALVVLALLTVCYKGLAYLLPIPVLVYALLRLSRGLVRLKRNFDKHTNDKNAHKTGE